MAGEKFLSEEEVSKELGINKAQLEEFVRMGKILPSYKDGMRKFKSSEVEKLKLSLSEKTEVPPVETSSKPEVPPRVETPPEAPPIAEEVGSTRVIEPPKEAPRLRVKKQTAPSEKPDFLKGPSASVPIVSSMGKLESILLILSLLLLIFSAGSLYFVWKGSSLPSILLTVIKSISGLGG